MNTIKVILQKHSLRQTQQGNVVSYLVDPTLMPDKLATDPLGTMYGAVLVEVDENDQAVDGNEQAARSSTGSEHRNSTPGVGGSNPPAPAKPKRSFNEMPRAQQAGMLCQDEKFIRWFAVTDDVAEDVRTYLGVTSRGDIDKMPHAISAWDGLVARYRQETGQLAEMR